GHLPFPAADRNHVADDDAVVVGDAGLVGRAGLAQDEFVVGHPPTLSPGLTIAMMWIEMDPLEAAGDPELREALLCARGQARPVTADELAAAREVHRNVARARLERLAEAGLLE